MSIENNKTESKRDDFLSLLEQYKTARPNLFDTLQERLYYLADEGNYIELSVIRDFMAELLTCMAKKQIVFEGAYYNENAPSLLLKLYSFFDMIYEDEGVAFMLDEAVVKWNCEDFSYRQDSLIQKYSQQQKEVANG